MNVSSLGSNTASLNPQQIGQPNDKELQALKSDLKSGNLVAAQHDFAALQQALQAAQPTSATSQSDFNSLQKSAIQSGNITSANQVLAAHGKNLPGANQAHDKNHHHEHHSIAHTTAVGKHSASPAVSGLMA